MYPRATRTRPTPYRFTPQQFDRNPSFEFYVSFIELYNEEIRDLLNPGERRPSSHSPPHPPPSLSDRNTTAFQAHALARVLGSTSARTRCAALKWPG